MPRPTELEITRNGDEYVLKLTPNQPFKSAVKKAWTIKPDAQTIASSCRGIEEAVNAANTRPDQVGKGVNPFVAAGRGIHRELFHNRNDSESLDSLRKTLRRLKTPLLISTDIPDVYWELMYDEDDKEKGEFFALRHSIGRQLHTRNFSTGKPRNRDHWRCLLIANPNSDEPEWALPRMSDAAIELKKWLEHRGMEVDLLKEENATFDNVLKCLGGFKYDLIHYGGHVINESKPNTPNSFAMRLRREKSSAKPLGAASISSHVRGQPIVFLNACWTGKAYGLASPPGIVQGLTDAFLAAGAQLVIGSQFEAPAEGAREFAENFYDAVLKGTPVGEAIRLARLHVRGKPKFGAAWACFVMYGDPCLRFNVEESDSDRLSELLADANSKREHFDEKALHLIELALDYSGGSNLVSTMELFAALVDSDTCEIQARLTAQGVPVKRLAEAFKSGLSAINAPGKAPSQRKKNEKARFTENTREITIEARHIATATGRSQVHEGDILSAFVKKGGGNTRRILEGMVELRDLLPPPAIWLMKPHYTAQTWGGLMHSVALAHASPRKLVESVQLFSGMLLNKEGPLVKALRDLGIERTGERIGNNGHHHPVDESIVGEVKPTDNVAKMLQLAKQIAHAAGRSAVTEHDLLVGFVQQGGGSVGKALGRKWAALEALLGVSSQEPEELDLDQLAVELRHVFKEAQIFSRQKGHRAYGRQHVLYAMLNGENTLLAKLIREQGKDPSQFADLLYVRIVKDTSTDTRRADNPIPPSLGLANILAAIKRVSDPRELRQISERELLLLFLENLDKEWQDLLIRNGVRWRGLIKKCQSLVSPADNAEK